MTKLTKSEQNEELFMTWGRMYHIIKHSENDRLIALANKLDEDLIVAKIEEKYFIEKTG